MSSKIIKKRFVNLNPPKVFEIHPKVENTDDEKDDIEKLRLELKEKKKEYEQRIAKAKKEAEDIITNAKKEVELLKKEVLARAKEEGFDIGYDEGMLKAKADIQEWIENLKKIIVDIENSEKNIIEENKKFIAKLVKSLVEKVIAKEISESSEEIVMQIIEEISKELSGKSNIKVQISKADYANIVEKYDRIKEMFLGADKILIKPDGNLKPGDVFIDTEIGSYDALIESKIKEAFRVFNEGSGGA